MTEKEVNDLKKILDQKAIKTVFQPIISLKDGEVLGHEALSRITCECEIGDMETLFALANKWNCLWDLEQLCRTKAFEAAFRFMVPPYNKKLFINVNPNVLHDETFQKGLTKEYLSQYKISASNIIFEITERNIIKDLDSFIATIKHYKSQGYKIAIDDAGAGYSGLNLISDVNPNFIKLDMKMIRDIHKDSLKAALVKGMVELSKISNIPLIAEGIEKEEELAALIDLGVQFGQGYFIQYPDSEIKDINPYLISRIREAFLCKSSSMLGNFMHMPIEKICTKTDTIHPTAFVEEVFNIFKHNPECFGLCVVDDHVPLGTITKEKLALKLSGQYGFALYQNKPISHIMDRNFMSVDCKTSVKTVSTVAMERDQDKLYDFIVVKKCGKYMGTATIKDLLKKATEIEIAAAKHQNPLTGLPGNLLIEQKFQQCIAEVEKFTVAYLDIDNFKAYNDVYGFENGDLVLKLLASVIIKNMHKNEFVGHVGGDDFVVIVNDHVEDEFFRNIVTEFESEVLKYYNRDDVERGFITTANRHSVVEDFPLITVTLVAESNKNRQFRDLFELTEILAGMKKAKKTRLRNVV
jgi:EAL domain-containing protein (putative c-di-GMP-specific phosphodiesterase class I)/GGDEF domain-containing protein/CBS domain-containing protein